MDDPKKRILKGHTIKLVIDATSGVAMDDPKKRILKVTSRQRTWYNQIIVAMDDPKKRILKGHLRRDRRTLPFQLQWTIRRRGY